MTTLLLLGLLLPTPDAGTNRLAEPCVVQAGRAFDFWIGAWEIEQEILAADGSWLTFGAETTVEPALGGCALVERWSGTVQFFWESMDAPAHREGLSVRSYDPESGQWNIYWMDSRSPRFQGVYMGMIEDGHGEFFRDMFLPDTETPGGRQVGRIRFERIDDGRVEWELAIAGDDGGPWTTLWKMHMRRPVP